jgi:hypothetical protein
MRLVALKIQEIIPNIVVYVNEVPKEWVDYEIYCQLVPNYDPNQATYKVLPRIGAFEVSFKGVVSTFLLYVTVIFSSYSQNFFRNYGRTLMQLPRNVESCTMTIDKVMILQNIPQMGRKTSVLR